MEYYKVEIWREMLFGHAVAVSKNGRVVARSTTWTKRGAKREARRIIKKSQPRQRVQYVIHN